MNIELEMTKEELIEFLAAQRDDFIIHVQLEMEDDKNAKECI